MEVDCVFYLREQTVVVVLPMPRNLNPLVVLVSVMDELPNEET